MDWGNFMKAALAEGRKWANKGRVWVATDKASKREVDKRALQLALIASVLVMAVMPDLALADPWDGMATQVLAIFTSGLTRTIAIISVIACGIAAIAGKLSWDWAIKIAVGIVLIFGATSIVDYLISAAGGGAT